MPVLGLAAETVTLKSLIVGLRSWHVPGLRDHNWVHSHFLRGALQDFGAKIIPQSAEFFFAIETRGSTPS